MISVQSKDQTSMKRIFNRYQRMPKNDIRSSYVGLCGTRLTRPLKALSHEGRIGQHMRNDEWRLPHKNEWRWQRRKITRTNNPNYLMMSVSPVKGSTDIITRVFCVLRPLQTACGDIIHQKAVFKSSYDVTTVCFKEKWTLAEKIVF